MKGSNGWRTTGAPSKCHSCLKLADNFSYAHAANNKAVKGPDVFKNENKKTCMTSKVYMTVNLQGTVYMLQTQSDLEMAVVLSGAILCGHETLRR